MARKKQEWTKAYWERYASNVEGLSMVQRGQLLTACIVYFTTGAIEPLDNMTMMAFGGMKQDIDMSIKVYDDMCSRNAGNIKKRYQSTTPTKSTTCTESTTPTKSTTVYQIEEKRKEEKRIPLSSTGRQKENRGMGEETTPCIVENSGFQHETEAERIARLERKKQEEIEKAHRLMEGG